MSRIDTITISGLKLHDCEETVNLSGLDIFTGPNGCGKTTVLDAVQIGMQGYVPARGKRLEDTFGMHNPASPALRVTLDYDNGVSVAEQITQVKGKLSESIEIDGEDTKVADGKRIRKELLGDFPLMFDLGEFTGMSDAKKMDFLAGLVSSELTKEGAPSAVLIRVLRELKGNDAFNTIADTLGLPADAAADAIAEKMPEEQRRLIKGAIVSAQIEIEKAETPMGGLEKFHKDIHRTALDTAKSLKDKEAEVSGCADPDGYVDPASIARMEETLAATRGQLNTALQDQGAARNAAGTFRARSERIAALEDELPQHVSLSQEGESLADGERERIQGVIDALGRKHIEKSDELTKTVNLLDLNRLLVSMNAEGGGCPTCKRTVDADAAASATIEIGLLTDKREILMEELAEIEKEIDEQQAALDHSAEVVKANKRVAEIVKELEQLRAEVGQVPNSKMIDIQVDGLRETMRELEADIDAGKMALAKLEQRAAAELAVEQIRERLNVEQAIDRAVRDLIHDSVRSGSEAIEAQVQALLSEIDAGMVFSLGFDDKDRLKFGLQRFGIFVPFAALSGGESVLVSCALATALIILRNPPCKVLMIEAAEVDERHGIELLKGLAKMSAHLDNVLVATCHNLTPDAADGWTVHEMGGDS